MLGYGLYQKGGRNYEALEARANEIEDELDELYKEYFALDDEEEAEYLYGDEIADLKYELEELNAQMGEIEVARLTHDYYRSLL